MIKNDIWDGRRALNAVFQRPAVIKRTAQVRGVNRLNASLLTLSFSSLLFLVVFFVGQKMLYESPRR